MTHDEDRARAAGPRGIALVTGAGKRIGRAIALDLAASGWDVAVHYGTSRGEAEEVAAGVERGGRRAAVLAADLADEAETAGLIERAAAALGPVTCLINNASVFEKDDPLTADRQSWDQHMDVNLRAPFVLASALFRDLPADANGLVVNILDQRVWNLSPFFMSYTVSKAALWTLTQTLAMAMAPRVRVNGVGPGPVLPSPRQTQEQFDRQWSQVPLARPVDPQEICSAVRFLLDAPSVTGQMIAVDGGQHLGWTRQAVLQGLDE